jgi:quercetin dioxygenase-like cupin family protein
MMPALLASIIPCAVQGEDTSSAIQIETPYPKYILMGWNILYFLPCRTTQITILKITIVPHTTMKWHSHPLPNAGYILSSELTIDKKDGTKQHFVAGQAVTETVNSVHLGITGAEPTVLIVFYPGTPGLPLSR